MGGYTKSALQGDNKQRSDKLSIKDIQKSHQYVYVPSTPIRIPRSEQVRSYPNSIWVPKPISSENNVVSSLQTPNIDSHITHPGCGIAEPNESGGFDGDAGLTVDEDPSLHGKQNDGDANAIVSEDHGYYSARVSRLQTVLQESDDLQFPLEEDCTMKVKKKGGLDTGQQLTHSAIACSGNEPASDDSHRSTTYSFTMSPAHIISDGTDAQTEEFQPREEEERDSKPQYVENGPGYMPSRGRTSACVVGTFPPVPQYESPPLSDASWLERFHKPEERDPLYGKPDYKPFN